MYVLSLTKKLNYPWHPVCLVALLTSVRSSELHALEPQEY